MSRNEARLGKGCDPLTIGENCWIGAGAIICPANVVAAGNPCKVIQEIDERDKQFYYKDRPITEEDLAEEKKLRRQ